MSDKVDERTGMFPGIYRTEHSSCELPFPSERNNPLPATSMYDTSHVRTGLTCGMQQELQDTVNWVLAQY